MPYGAGYKASYNFVTKVHNKSVHLPINALFSHSASFEEKPRNITDVVPLEQGVLAIVVRISRILPSSIMRGQLYDRMLRFWVKKVSGKRSTVNQVSLLASILELGVITKTPRRLTMQMNICMTRNYDF